MKKIYLILGGLLIALTSVTAKNIQISGFVTSVELNTKIVPVNVLLQRADSTYVAGMGTDAEGKFQINNIEPGDYRLLISLIGYTTITTELQGLSKSIDLGELHLMLEHVNIKDVVVTAHNVVNQTDRKLIFPSKKQVASSTNGINLLQTMMLPRVAIDPITSEVSAADGGEVQVRINGVQVSNREVVALQPQEIVRVEFIESPGLRYNNASIVINYITRRHESGGYISLDLTNSVNVMFGDDQLSGKFNHKKSEFGVSYYIAYRDFTEYMRDNEDIFRFEDGSELRRNEEGLPGRFTRQRHMVSLNYNYKPSDKSFFNATVKYLHINLPHDDFRSLILPDKSQDKSIQMNDLNSQKVSNPSLDLYYMRNLKKKQTLFLNVVGVYNKSNTSRTYQEIFNNDYLSDVYSNISGEKYSIIGEAIYEKQFKSGKLSAGLKHTHTISNNSYADSKESKTKMKQANSYGYVEYQGQIKKLNYTLGVGVNRFWMKQESQSDYENYVFRPRLSLNYAFNKNFYARMNARIENISPSLSELSAVEQLIDTLQIQRGNPDLLPYKQYWTDFYIEFRKDKFSISNYTFYLNQPKVIMGSIYREDDKFIHTFENQKRWQKISSELTLKAGAFWDILQFSATAGFSQSISDGNDYSHTYNNWYYRASVMAMYKRMTFMFEMKTNQNDLRGEVVRGGENNHVLMAMYKHKNIAIAAAIINPFVDNFKIVGENRNKYVSNTREWYTNESSRMVALKFSWNLQFGRQYRTSKKRLNNRDESTGIMKVGK